MRDCGPQPPPAALNNIWERRRGRLCSTFYFLLRDKDETFFCQN
jgi:hypothetical protein